MRLCAALCAVLILGGCLGTKPSPQIPPKTLRSPPMPTAKALVVAPGNVTARWTYDLTANPGTQFRLYSGADSHSYTNSTDAGQNLSVRVNATAPTNYFVVTAYGTNGQESLFSAEAVYVLPVVTNVSYLYIQTNSTLNPNSWGLLYTTPVITLSNPPVLFYRLLIQK